MGSTIKIKAPGDYDFARDFCSYGYFLLAPSAWDPSTQTLYRPFDLAGVGREPAVPVRIDQAGRGEPVRARSATALSKPEQAELRRQVTRMLWLDGAGDEASLKRFHKMDPRWKRSGRGRLCRGVSLFEDIIKTVTSCNVAWPNTINMNELLCLHAGPKAPGGNAFPRPTQLSRKRAATLRARCKVGYRDQRIVDLARLYNRGEIDEAWLTDPANTDEEVLKFLVSLPGIGPYAARNILQLLGRYGHVPVDTETVRHAKVVLGYTGTHRSIEKKAAAHYDGFGDQAFRSYWFELLEFYESKKGPARLWHPRTTGRTFTKAAFDAMDRADG